MILDKIAEVKKKELVKSKKKTSISRLEDLIKKAPDVNNFKPALKKDLGGKNRIIAEIKKASPSKGIICKHFDPLRIAEVYERHGAVAVSVLTEENYFLGRLEHLAAVKKNVSIPVLRKDFLFDPYHVYQSRAFGADALLLIVALLLKDRLTELLQLCEKLSLSALVEVHTSEELEMALDAGASIIGINNRDLQTFKTDIQTTLDLVANIPHNIIIVSESGITTKDDIARLNEAGVDAFLVGESLMKADDPGKKLDSLM